MSLKVRRADLHQDRTDYILTSGELKVGRIYEVADAPATFR
jgi:hypothetical protein